VVTVALLPLALHSDELDNLLFVMETKGYGAEAPDPQETSVPAARRREAARNPAPATNELEILAFCALRFYQLFISTQDRPSCMFTPTCSNYALQAIRHHGLLRGILMASDRFQRCNGWGRELYPLDPATGKLSDPP
jgi:putative membrane protein insertion efficiency factor